ncbi:distal tail protein Dit [Clostridium tetani]|uniref:Siphovirus-type tail component RIFT-related domain-containing protein n=1 Tax=Clostridium tetani TaxID=1513 RepID=A0ABY0ERI4_CLOTA|nr:distal tail protein Dit [Clostridium tetani]RXI57409.1 hypothetical protein DP131_05255 [Clostridium tetani]RXI66987.1 hypothetical protein DQN76_12640 [Clostridium tetani]
MFSIQFNNYNSYKDLGLIVEHRPNTPITEKDVRHIYIQGRNGSLTEDLGTYRDIEISISFGFKAKDKNNFGYKCRMIKMWLLNVENNKLSFSDDEVFYKVKNIKFDEEGIERGLRTLGKFTVTFVCDPFSYLDSELITITKNNFIIYNEGTFESQPYMKIFATGDIILNINDEVIKLENIIDYIELDSEIMECYKEHQNCNNKIIGEFPILKVGENKISWTGNVSKIEITPRWRCL